MAKEHLTMRFGETSEGKCCVCGTQTVLVTTMETWNVPDAPLAHEGEVSVYDEVSGHYCEQCERLTSLSLNCR